MTDTEFDLNPEQPPGQQPEYGSASIMARLARVLSGLRSAWRDDGWGVPDDEQIDDAPWLPIDYQAEQSNSAANAELPTDDEDGVAPPPCSDAVLASDAPRVSSEQARPRPPLLAVAMRAGKWLLDAYTPYGISAWPVQRSQTHRDWPLG